MKHDLFAKLQSPSLSELSGGSAMANRLVTPSQTELQNDDEKQIRGKIAQWQALFSRGEGRYTLSGYEHLFANSDELLVYDNFAPVNIRFTGFDTYRTTWERTINEDFPGYVMYRVDIERIEVDGDIAWSAINWWGKITKHGKTTYTSQHGTHGWRRIDGEWRIMHEHLTGPIMENQQEAWRPEP
jgi:ketosteroid isomerase-like protein